MTDFYVLVFRIASSELWLDPVKKEIIHLYNEEIVGTIEFKKNKMELWNKLDKIREVKL